MLVLKYRRGGTKKEALEIRMDNLRSLLGIKGIVEIVNVRFS